MELDKRIRRSRVTDEKQKAIKEINFICPSCGISYGLNALKAATIRRTLNVLKQT